MAWHRPHFLYPVLLAICTCWAITVAAAAADSSAGVSLSRAGRTLLQQQLQCGGMTNCARGGYNYCTDEQWSQYTCPSGTFCNRQNKWYWMCIPNPEATTRQPSAPSPAVEAPASGSDVAIPGLVGGTTSNASAIDNSWQMWWCRQVSDGGVGTWYWQCLPGTDNATPPQEPTPQPPTPLPPTTPVPAAPVTPNPTPAPIVPDSQPLSKPYPLTGTNSYFLLVRGEYCRYLGGQYDTAPAVLDTLDGAVTNGFKVIRIWAFADGSGWNFLQTQPGVYNDTVLAGLDWLLKEGNKRGLQFMMTLTNGWPDYGGIRQYVRWANGVPDDADVGNKEFFYNTKARNYFRDFAKFMVTRYRGSPAVHSWDICNQPRADGDKSGAIAKWVAETAALVKSVDKKHPVTVGLDGFFGPSTPELLEYNPYTQDSGNDVVAECKSVDFCSFHMYPNSWRGTAYSAEEQASWAVKWIDGHIIASQKYLNNKPILLTEYSIQPAGATRELMFQKVSDRLVTSIQNKEPFVGAMVWMWASPLYPYDDGYTIRTNENSKQLDIIREMNAAVLAAIHA